MSRLEILDRIDAEREYQIERWGDADDLVNTPNDFVSYLSHYSTKWFNGSFAPYNTETIYKFRDSMIKNAAIAVAAVEFADKLINREIERPDVYDPQL
jgi:hypothetical protein